MNPYNVTPITSFMFGEQNQLDSEFQSMNDEQDRQQLSIDGAVDDLLKDDDLITEILAENAPEVWEAIKSDKEVAEKLRALIIKNLEIEAQRNLNL